MTFRSVAAPSPSASSHHPPVYTTKATDTRAKEAITKSARVRGLTSMRRRGPWSPRPRRRAAAAAARRAPGSGSETSDGLPRLLAAAVGRRVLLPPPVIGKLSPAISPFLLGTVTSRVVTLGSWQSGGVSIRTLLVFASLLRLRNIGLTP